MEPTIQSEHPASRGGLQGSLPVLLMLLALLLWFSFQLFQAFKARDALEQAFLAQQPQVESSNKIRKSLSGLALATKQVANQGNPNAAAVVSNLAGRGINIADPQASPAQPAKP